METTAFVFMMWSLALAVLSVPIRMAFPREMNRRTTALEGTLSLAISALMIASTIYLYTH